MSGNKGYDLENFDDSKRTGRHYKAEPDYGDSFNDSFSFEEPVDNTEYTEDNGYDSEYFDDDVTDDAPLDYGDSFDNADASVPDKTRVFDPISPDYGYSKPQEDTADADKKKNIAIIALVIALAVVIFVFALILFLGSDKDDDKTKETTAPTAATYFAGNQRANVL